ncbi:MAG TPA: hypothetical protein VM889_08750 [Candidatus Thermoplasmatota archaeon]|nr:hypothetical protein [Candidatus Thermoplasmatota archaeon]
MPRPRPAPLVASLYLRDGADRDAIQARADAAGLSFSAYVVAAAKGDLVPGTGASEALRHAEAEAKYWRERFERMAALAESTQAEVLQLRAEARSREAARAGGEVGSTDLAPRLLVVLTSLRGADGKPRVWTEGDLLVDLGLDARRDPAAPERLRANLATLYRSGLIEPMRNGWRYRAEG